MNDGVGMAAIDEALAPGRDGQLAVGDGPRFEVEGGRDPQGAAVRRRVGHEHRLHELELGQVPAQRLPAGIGAGKDPAAGNRGGGRAALPAHGGGQGGE